MKLMNAVVVSNRQVADLEYIMAVSCPEIVAEAQPGQFVTLRVSQQIQPLLRRPISIHDVDAEQGLLYLYYHVVGTGTMLLSQFRAGEAISVMGPLGKGFDLAISGSPVCVVGGGIGQAPLLYLTKALAAKGNRVLAVMGARDAGGLPVLSPYETLAETLRPVTEDGSLGSQGYVTDAMGDLSELGIQRIYSCGPLPMLRAVKALAAKQGIPCQVSLEEKMACGLGVCLGCTCKHPDGERPYHKVCTDGPVFWAEEVDLNG